MNYTGRLCLTLWLLFCYGGGLEQPAVAQEKPAHVEKNITQDHREQARPQEKKMSYPFSAPGHNLPVVSTAYLFSVLGIITVAIVLSVWVLKTVARGKSSHSRILVLKESLYLGNKSFLHAVAVQDKLLVIGVSPHGISTLAELENIATSQPAASVPAAPFAQILTNLLASGQPAKHPEQNIALSPSSDAKATKTP